MMILGWQYSYSQGVTTSTMVGNVTGVGGDGLVGATVLATHTPSGTTYGVSTDINGMYRISNMRVGGPYTVVFSYVGFTSQNIESVYLTLGETYNLSVRLEEDIRQLDDIVVLGMDSSTFNAERTGAALNVSRNRIDAVPTINRSVNDLTKLFPQSNGSSFAGRDNRFNNYTIDGNIYNNNFGLGSDQFAGGNPISLDVIEQLQINVAPYDVRFGGFTGASVNAVTKSGDNSFKGSAYTFYRNQDLVGDKVGKSELDISDSYTRTVGVSLGGPIVRNRLFFFASVEKEESDNPGDNRRALRAGQTPDGSQISRVPIERAQFVRDQIAALYGYETGGFESISFGNEALRLNLRLDYNINKNHRAMFRFNNYDTFRDVSVNGNSIRGFPGADRYAYTNRFGAEGLTFRNNNYTQDNIIRSVVGELNSTFGDRVSNSFNIGWTSITDPRRGIPNGQVFPMIEIMEPDANGVPYYYMTLGNELFSVGNLLENEVYSISNTTTYFRGRHTFTGGINFEYMTFANAFNPVWNSWYRYQTYDDFVESVINRNVNVRPSHFAIGFTFDKDNPTTLPLDRVNFSQFGVYLQDEFQVNPNLRLTAGLRVDLPFYPIDAPRNETVEGLNLSIPNPNGGNPITPDVSKFPSINPLWSPRFGFNWDVNGDRTFQVRGGSGVFSGRLPFVWVSNQINANGVMRGQRGYYANNWGSGTNPQWTGFQADPNVYRPNPNTLTAEIPNQINITADDFKLPQVWRSNLAVDYKLPFGLIGTVEGIYSKDYNSPLAVNLAHQPTGQVAKVGGNEYPLYRTQVPNAPSALREVYYLTNINKGSYQSLTVGLEKLFDSGFYGSVNYTRSVSRDYGLIGGSQAQSLWPNVVQQDRNNPEVGYSGSDVPNRVIAQFSYTTENFVPNYPTKISVVYSGGDQGRYSYVYGGSFGDGAGVRLMYVPKNMEDAQLITFGGRTPAQQWELLESYISQSSYLSSIRGEVSERNGALLPWLHRFDVRLTQDVRVLNNHRVQLTFDVLNLGNLIDSEWGISKTPIQRNLLQYRGMDGNGNAQFSVNNAPGSTTIAEDSYRNVVSVSNTWSAQVGVRYLFGR
jgi:hypothetical protein